MKNVRPLIVLVKALVLYLFANLAFAYFEPDLGKISIYNRLVPGRERVPYEREVENYPVSHTMPVYEDMDAMYRSHILAMTKPRDEYRVILVGDSSAWGFELRPEQTLAGSLNSLNLKTCNGRRIVVYNAAFPLPYVMKDLLIMDKMREYDPDMFLWTLTLDGFRNRTVFTRFFLNPYSERVYELIDQYGISNLDTEKMQSPTFWDRTIIGQSSRLKKIFLLQLHGFGWSATGLDYDYRDYPPLSQDLTESDLFFEIARDQLNLDAQLFDVLHAGYRLAGDTPILFVNEPIFIANGNNHDIRYNEFYPRWAYDEYLVYLESLMKRNQYNYIDAWRSLPATEFTNTAFHRTPAGEIIFAKILAPEIERLSCSR